MARTIALVVAMDQHRAIGRDGALPWHLPDDLKRFRALTLGKTVLMGRKTYQSIGRPLPKRRNVVLTRDPHFRAEGVEVVHVPEEALQLDEELMVIGGGEVYALFLPLATHLYLTLVDTAVPGADAFFPAWNPQDWRETHREHHPADERHALAFTYVDLERRDSPSLSATSAVPTATVRGVETAVELAEGPFETFPVLVKQGRVPAGGWRVTTVCVALQQAINLSPVGP
ncbi:MAG: dihydrofolate reductase [Meiothermus sp.]|uniref:dihydrofolate reductase n=1 Tax=Meiothermus sp. TaxID=1955249 RepID=UPI0025FCCB0B|nr:dihydrofolate reductase [Meiothermus sp.]MCS7067822.1 dihydrofolate reductase [Meiothermus sp.]